MKSFAYTGHWDAWKLDKYKNIYNIQWNNLTIYLMLIWIDEGRSISFHDSGFLPSNLLDRVTQQTVKNFKPIFFSVHNKL